MIVKVKMFSGNVSNKLNTPQIEFTPPRAKNSKLKNLKTACVKLPSVNSQDKENTPPSNSARTLRQRKVNAVSQSNPKKRKLPRENLPYDNSSSERTEGLPVNFETVKLHAYKRLHLMMLEYCAEFRSTITSKGTHLAIEISTEGATLQVGKGTDGRQAAHSFPSAGRTDNMKEKTIEAIIEDGVTPIKKQYLGLKLASKKLEEIQANHENKSFVEKALESVYGDERVSCFWRGTELEIELNSTLALPKELNRVDSGIEKFLRPIQDSWINPSVSNGSMRPEVAIHLACNLIQEHFRDRVIPGLKEKIKGLNHYSETLTAFLNNENLTQEERLQLVNELYQIKIPLEKRINGVPKAKLTINDKFLKYAKVNILKQNVIFGSRQNATKEIERLNKEINAKLKVYHEMLKFSEWEFKGTKVPPVQYYTSKFNPETQEFIPLNEEEFKALALGLLKPREPAKKRARTKIPPKTLFA